MNTATRIPSWRDGYVSPYHSEGEGAGLYRLDPPLDGHSHVVVSAIVYGAGGPETMVFGAAADGYILEWVGLAGSRRGDLDIPAALQRAGYTIVEPT